MVIKFKRVLKVEIFPIDHAAVNFVRKKIKENKVCLVFIYIIYFEYMIHCSNINAFDYGVLLLTPLRT